ncbi:unnamed protein product [Orchesella dallaii]|uniref:Very-long-chain 3-oxoacyl-CoA reductase n=1 Tax=Orchesella dallaii TaxID=48710 RepID=A0ABP1Q366_9HEXA
MAIKTRQGLSGIWVLTFVFQYFLRFNVLQFIGCFASLYINKFVIYHIIIFIYQNWVGVLLNHNANIKRLGSWAVITGCTSGIGKAYALALAKLGVNVVLLSRSNEKLKAVAKEVREFCGEKIQVKLIPVDFTGGLEIYQHIGNELRDLDIGILVNNVATCYPWPEYFVDLPNGQNFQKDMINCNMLSVVMMTSILLPRMVEKGKGAVVNVSSITSKVDSPFMTLYGATKTFVNKFTLDLALEYEDRGVIFQSLVPGYVVSNMSKVKVPTFFIPTAEQFVDKALLMIGLSPQTAAYVSHQVIFEFIHLAHFLGRDMVAEITSTLWKQYWILDVWKKT